MPQHAQAIALVGYANENDIEFDHELEQIAAAIIFRMEDNIKAAYGLPSSPETVRCSVSKNTAIVFLLANALLIRQVQ
jgi:hypothetical protein